MWCTMTDARMCIALAMAKTTSGKPGCSSKRDWMVGCMPAWRRRASAWGSYRWVTAVEMSTQPKELREGLVVFCLIRLRMRVSAAMLWLPVRLGDDAAAL